MLKIYGVARSRAARPIWLAHELGLPFELVPVMQAYRLANPDAVDAPLNTRSPEFLAINPSGQIPSIDSDGLVLHESLAITLYLAKTHGGPLAPAGQAEEAVMTQWTVWAAGTIEPLVNDVLLNRAVRPPAERDERAALAAIGLLRVPFGMLDQQLSDRPYLVGGRFTVADLNVAEVMRYAQFAPELFVHAPHVKAWLEACHARPAFKAMMALRESEPA